jgi:hypothetical protein
MMSDEGESELGSLSCAFLNDARFLMKWSGGSNVCRLRAAGNTYVQHWPGRQEAPPRPASLSPIFLHMWLSPCRANWFLPSESSHRFELALALQLGQAGRFRLRSVSFCHQLISIPYIRIKHAFVNRYSPRSNARNVPLSTAMTIACEMIFIDKALQQELARIEGSALDIESCGIIPLIAFRSPTESLRESC